MILVTDFLLSIPCRCKDGTCSLRNGKGTAGMFKEFQVYYYYYYYWEHNILGTYICS